MSNIKVSEIYDALINGVALTYEDDKGIYLTIKGKGYAVDPIINYFYDKLDKMLKVI